MTNNDGKNDPFNRSLIKHSFNNVADDGGRLKLEGLRARFSIGWAGLHQKTAGNIRDTVYGPRSESHQKNTNYDNGRTFDFDVTIPVINLNNTYTPQSTDDTASVSKGIYTKLNFNLFETDNITDGTKDVQFDYRGDRTFGGGLGFQHIDYDQKTLYAAFAMIEHTRSHLETELYNVSNTSIGAEGIIRRPKWDISAKIMSPVSIKQESLPSKYEAHGQPSFFKGLDIDLEYSHLLVPLGQNGSKINASASLGTGDYIQYTPAKTYKDYPGAPTLIEGNLNNTVESTMPLSIGLGLTATF